MGEEKTELDAEVAAPMLGSGVSSSKLIEDKSALARQLMATVAGTLVAVSDGMGYGWTSPFVPYLESDQSHIKINDTQGEWLETISLIGAACGLPGTIYFTEKIGRKFSMQLAGVIAMSSWIIMLLAPSIEWLYAGRFLIGMAGDMCFVAAPMYIAEIAHHEIRGFLSSLIYLSMLVGLTTVYAVGSYAPYYTVSIIGIVLISVQLVVFSFMPESAYYLVQKNKIEKAKQSIAFFRPGEDVDKEIAVISEALERQSRERTGARPQDLILDRSNRRSLLIMTVLNGGQHFAAISVLYMNLHPILEEAGSVYIDSNVAAILFAVTMLIAAGVTSLLMDKLGRLTLLLVSGLFTGVCLLVIAIYFHLKNTGVDVATVSWIPAVTILVYAVAFKLGVGMVPIVVTSEIFPQNIKAIGMTFADIIYVIAGILALQVYYYLYTFGMHAPFYLFASCTFAILVYTYFFVPETKGKTLDEIQQMLEGKSSKRNSVAAYMY